MFSFTYVEHVVEIEVAYDVFLVNERQAFLSITDRKDHGNDYLQVVLQ
jgi:hypothetical protein